MMRYKLLASLIGMMVVLTFAAQAQDDCPAIIQTALATIDSVCADTGRNEACYGNFTLEVEPQPGVRLMAFDAPGDIISVSAIQSLSLTGLDEDVPEWGMAWMKLQANLPDTLPGQNVTIMLFGQVELSSAGETAPEGYTPLQAFYFRSGVGDSPCAAAPDSGMMIQTPEGVGEIEIVVNEVRIQLGSTAYLQAEPGNNLVISVVEGQAVVTAFDVMRTVPAGARVSIPIDDHLVAVGPPFIQESYAPDAVQAVPVHALPHPVEIAPPLDEDALATIRERDENPRLEVFVLPQCFQGDTITAPAGALYYALASDAPHFATSVPLFSFNFSLNGHTLPAMGPRRLNGDAVQQLFYIGVLPSGDYSARFSASVNAQIVDPNGDKWGPESWSHTCTLIVE